jgi:hypothetical protein
MAHLIDVDDRRTPAVVSIHGCNPVVQVVRSSRLRDQATPRRLRAHSRVGSAAGVTEFTLGLFDRRDRRPVAIVITSDGRRVQVPMNDSGFEDVSVLGILRSLLLGLDGLLGLITGSRRENGGPRRDGR